ncbi:lipase family protein [Aspergillus saccharolyticus JOP 1030-1]|uniref:feruloyl esterase n=1 Tax=Aspergillus saccharolyticus JOP 1030-1 TaxID=1450539 RepID=A0A318Z6L3_9EURO|nr:mono and diacylglycerol lipase precursor [Aspergillus saccharolyticus JOP 1030-1]PYH42941.1 mono and diacylglycerol lipase precursor [Aspergillus saccharolyticus JOP 1030-1]
MHLPRFLVATLSALPCSALPALQARESTPSTITPETLASFDFWVQYAAAAYCEPNYIAQAGQKLACWAGNCPAVEAADTTILLDFSNATITDTAGFLAVDHTHSSLILAFRGSYSVRNWVTDATFLYTDPQLCPGCFAELGFWSAWTNVRANITAALTRAREQYPTYSLQVVGHSLGAAIATLAAADLRATAGETVELYAFASPRVANPVLAQYITAQATQQQKGANYRFTHTVDPVPNLPLLAMGYSHVSPEYHITAPDNSTVVASQVVVYSDGDYVRGNTGVGVPDLLRFDAHHWYFERADACIESGLPWR